MRVDVALIQRGLAPSRSKAKALIEEGRVYLGDHQLFKASAELSEDQIDELRTEASPLLRYASRAGLKLEAALQRFEIKDLIRDQVVLDVGSSTGGFTDCALNFGAKRVIAVDVGRDLMIPRLREDARVTLYEQTKVQDLAEDQLAQAQFVCCDVSFISLTKVVPTLKKSQAQHFVLLIKPQFECGPQLAKRCRGVIKKAEDRYLILKQVLLALEDEGFLLRALSPSPIRGGDGNMEFISYWTLADAERIGCFDVNVNFKEAAKNTIDLAPELASDREVKVLKKKYPLSLCPDFWAMLRQLCD